jgi:glucosamine-phosphate N-acetyltransferase
MINNFRETIFTYAQFIETLTYLKSFSEIWIVECDNDIIATGTVIYEKKFIHNNSFLGHIEDVCVKDAYHKLGIGKMLVNHLMTVAKNKGCYKVTLVCNESICNFYNKCGLEKRGVQMSQLTANI